MSTHNLRSQTAERVKHILGSRQARIHLASYGWSEGMPIVLAEPHELVDDIMGLVSIHGRSVLVALYNKDSDDLSFWFTSVPNPALENVPVEPTGTTMGSFTAQSPLNGTRTFRVKYWEHSAIIFEIPCYVRTDREHQTSYNTHPGTLSRPKTE